MKIKIIASLLVLGLVTFVNVQTIDGQTPLELSKVTKRVDRAYISADSKTIIAEIDKVVNVWDAATGKVLKQIVLPSKDVNHTASIFFFPEGKMIAHAHRPYPTKLEDYGDFKPSHILWDVSSGKVLESLGKSDYKETAYSPSSKKLAIESDGGTVKLWDAGTFKTLMTISTGETKGIRVLAFSPDGQILATGGYNKTVKLWDVSTGGLLKTLEHDDTIYGVAFSPDGKTLASTAADDPLRIWEISSGKLLHSFKASLYEDDDGNAKPVYYSEKNALAFSKDGKILAAANFSTILFWNIQKGDYKYLNHQESILSITFSPDGKYLVTTMAEDELDSDDRERGRQQQNTIKIRDVKAITF
jgi:WD40 repeat protein